ncbi:hypothetical protein FHR38_000194 [Micromonospora polyrhachis]|uniref:Uncharacterized protein n=1 Tax=Micromonospora polyrhachis TaxID=1282883 RepID=A0A7W7WLT3_9ACTN|nr:hypothetical protein [Micromonospora polyrhachis]
MGPARLAITTLGLPLRPAQRSMILEPDET